MGFQYVRGASGAAGSGLPAGTADENVLVWDAAASLWVAETQRYSSIALFHAGAILANSVPACQVFYDWQS